MFPPLRRKPGRRFPLGPALDSATLSPGLDIRHGHSSFALTSIGCLTLSVGRSRAQTARSILHPQLSYFPWSLSNCWPENGAETAGPTLCPFPTQPDSMQQFGLARENPNSYRGGHAGYPPDRWPNSDPIRPQCTPRIEKLRKGTRFYRTRPFGSGSSLNSPAGFATLETHHIASTGSTGFCPVASLTLNMELTSPGKFGLRPTLVASVSPTSS